MALDIGGLIVSAAVRPQQGRVINEYLVAELSVSIPGNACRLNGTNLVVLPSQNSLRTFLELLGCPVSLVTVQKSQAQNPFLCFQVSGRSPESQLW